MRMHGGASIYAHLCNRKKYKPNKPTPFLQTKINTQHGKKTERTSIWPDNFITTSYRTEVCRIPVVESCDQQRSGNAYGRIQGALTQPSANELGVRFTKKKF
jgi:hypothetical protein